eukprot:1176912-Prorocentrum_minimum.AAC.2
MSARTQAVMATNMWEMFAFPLRWAMEDPSEYKCFVGQHTTFNSVSPQPLTQKYLHTLELCI